MHETLNVIHSRRSHRAYKAAPLTREQLDVLIDAALQAPSAMNLQPWKMNYAGRTLQLLRTGLGAHELDMGIAMLHMSLGAQEKEHVVFWGEGQTAATLLAEDRE